MTGPSAVHEGTVWTALAELEWTVGVAEGGVWETWARSVIRGDRAGGQAVGMARDRAGWTGTPQN